MKIMQRGELFRRAQQTNLLNDLIELSEQSEFTDVQIITLKQWATEQAQDEAWNRCYFPGDVEPFAEQLYANKYVNVKEFVDVTTDRIQIGINAHEISDKEVNRAFAMLLDVGEIEPGKRFELGEEINIHDSSQQR